MRAIIFFSILLCGSALAAAQNGGKAEPKKLEIPRGKTSVAVVASLKTGEVSEYVFKARKGQYVAVRLVSVKPKGFFHGFIVKGDGIDFISEMVRLEVEKMLAPETGDYFIFVKFNPSGKVSQGTYRLTLEIKN